jgi:hypothetical protein
MKTTKLPDKPSELIRVALEDMRALEEDTRYRIDMGAWHHPGPVFCHVCAAGAVMARRLGVGPATKTSPSDFDDETSRKLFALDCFREGQVLIGLIRLDIAPGNYPLDVRITPYEVHREAFYRDMEALAAMLEGVGL